MSRYSYHSDVSNNFFGVVYGSWTRQNCSHSAAPEPIGIHHHITNKCDYIIEKLISLYALPVVVVQETIGKRKSILFADTFNVFGNKVFYVRMV